MSNEKQHLFKNIFASILQVIVVASSLFILYNFIINTLGVEKLGIWSIVLAVTSVGALSNFGLTGGVVKYISHYRAKNDTVKIKKIIGTSVTTVSLFSIFVILSLYPFADIILNYLIPANSIEEAMALLPYGLFSLWIMIVMGIFLSVLEGSHRIDQSTYLFSFGSVFYLLISFILVPKYGLLGLAYGRVTQLLILLSVSIILVKRLYPSLVIKDFLWKKNIFKELFSYSMNIQIAAFTQIFYEPLTKSLLTKFGSLEVTGYYEMSSRMIAQIRNLIVSSNKAIVPFISHQQVTTDIDNNKYFENNMRIIFKISFILFSIIIILLPVISFLWLGQINNTFVFISFFLCLAWSVNCISAPAYFFFQGKGKLRFNTTSHILILILNIGLSYFLALFFNWYGVIYGWSVAIVIGSLFTLVGYVKEYSFSISNIINKQEILLFVLLNSVISLGLVLYIKFVITNGLFVVYYGTILIIFVILSYLLIKSEINFLKRIIFR